MTPEEQAEWNALESGVLVTRMPLLASGLLYLLMFIITAGVGGILIGIRSIVVVVPMAMGLLPAGLAVAAGVLLRSNDPQSLLRGIKVQIALFWVLLALAIGTVLFTLAGGFYVASIL